MYNDVLQEADRYILLLSESANLITDPIDKNRFVGFVSVTAVTFFEEAFKEIVRDFSKKKNHVFGHFINKNYEKLNGRISLSDIRKEHIPKFGEKYAKKLDTILNKREADYLRENRGSIKSSYGNIITWRHNFVHGGAITANATFEEAVRSYNLGKVIFTCLDEALKR